MAEALSTLQLALLAQQAADQRRLLAAEPIAVVGMGCRFPAGPGRPDLHSPEAFWQFLLEGGEAVSEVPASRWPLERFYDPTPGTPGRMHCRHGAFLQAPDRFDPARFRISPREAQAMDPQHRLLMEVVQEALERAAVDPARLRGQAAGVYVGICTGDYAWRQLRGQAPDEGFDMYFATGTSFAMAAGRLAYVLGLQGPALAVDTACSSSLVAVDLACRSLRDRSSDLAVAAGVSLLLTPVNSLCFARSGMMAADGHCKTFDAAADGYVRGEGCGAVVLKRLSDALAAGDPILAVLRGSGVNQDGASAGLTVPNGEAQAALIRCTLEQAQLSGDVIDVLEAHGTGTPLGDPIELKALAPIYGRPERGEPLRLGSLKTNLGHLEGAAGIAGLIKAVLMVQHGRIPPHLHLRQRTPYLNWDNWALKIPATAEPWPQPLGAEPRPRRAAVSSFGFSGTNAHVLVEQAPSSLRPPAAEPAPPLREQDWLLLSAGSEAALRQLAQELAAWLPQQPASAWSAICATSRRSRSGLPWRLALPAADARQAAERLASAELPLQAVPPQPPALAVALQEASTANDWQAWCRFGVAATALVVPPQQQALAEALAGTPPQLRLITADGTAAAVLQEHGYGEPLLLQEPEPAALVQLWLVGHSIDWQPLEPAGLWPLQVLPTTPFDGVRCWVEEQASADSLAGLELEHQRSWQPLPAAAAPGMASATAAPIWLLGGSPALRSALAAALPNPPRVFEDLEAIDQALQACGAPPVLLLAPPADLQGLAEPFWQQQLPLLQGLIVRMARLGPVHWLLQGPDTPAGEAWAALARSWARELGPQAGGLLWCGPAGEGLAQLLAQRPGPGAGQEWRLDRDGWVQQLALEPLPPGAAAGPPQLPPTATTVITGGLGALGLATAEALQRWGARHLTLVGRRAPSPAQQLRLAALRQAGVELALEQLDVADAAAVAGLFARLAASGRPLAGIIHAAGVLDDGLLTNQTAARCAAVAAAKVQGGLHLERACRGMPHGFFVVYSSLAAAMGSPGQAAYAAANGFLDGLVLQRRAQGLPGLAINWGPWTGGGMADRQQTGLELLEPAQAVGLLERWLPRQGRVVLAQLRPAAAAHPLAPRLQALAAELAGLQPDQARHAVERCLAELLAELGGFVADELQPHTRLDALGLDSLMAVELAAAVQAGLGVSLGLGALAGEPSLGSLAAHLLAQLQVPGAEPPGAVVDLGAEARLPAALQAALQVLPPTAAAPGRSILLTGATGFLGAFLLADQLERHPELTITCLVRADGVAAARGRVRANLEHYGLWSEAWASRIVALPGDLALPGLGLDPSVRAGLLNQLGGILHNGAQLSYVAPYGQLRAANVGGTLAVLELAAEAGVPLEFISSTSVYEAAAYRGQELDETSDLAAWQGIHLGYSQTKWVSERLVWQAARSGLPVRIYRPPLIAGHSRSGAWHEHDFLHRLVRGCLALGQAPELPMELDLVPVDYVVQAIGALAWTPLSADGPGPDVLHLHHPRSVLWTTFLEGLIARGAPLRPEPLPGWLAALAAAPSNPLYPLQPFFTHRWGPERLTYPELNQPGLKARPSCLRSLERLERLGVHCPDFEQLVDPYARTFLADLLVHG